MELYLGRKNWIAIKDTHAQARVASGMSKEQRKHWGVYQDREIYESQNKRKFIDTFFASESWQALTGKQRHLYVKLVLRFCWQVCCQLLSRILKPGQAILLNWVHGIVLDAGICNLSVFLFPHPQLILVRSDSSLYNEFSQKQTPITVLATHARVQGQGELTRNC